MNLALDSAWHAVVRQSCKDEIARFSTACAIKSSYLLSFLESVPEVSAKLKEPATEERKFEDVVKDAEQVAVLVLVY